MKYESDILKRLINTYGVVGNPCYISEIIKEFIVRGKECYPELFTYQSDWLAHIDEFGLTPDYVVSYTGQQIYAPHTKESPVKRAILKGSTKYRDIDTGDVLDTFDETKNLELVSVKMPVLTTSNEDGTKTNILSTPSDLELRGVGDVQDELDLLTGEVTERIGEIVLNGSEGWMRAREKTNTVVFYSTVTNQIAKKISDTSKVSEANCDKLPSSSVDLGSSSSRDVEGCYIAFDGNICIAIAKSKLTSTGSVAFNQYLQSNPLTVYFELATPINKTVDLTIKDQNDIEVSQLSSFNGGTHFSTSSQEGSLLPSLIVDVVTNLEETLKVCSLEGNTM